jgi:glycosyltransferase involved in cell wall biosynthesis
MRILQINTSDVGGGAEKSARRLFDEYRRRGHASWLAVGFKRSEDPEVVEIGRGAPRGVWSAGCERLRSALGPLDGKIRGVGRARKYLDSLARLRNRFDRSLGREDFNYPDSWNVLGLPPEPPDIVHLHNLHGNYFDLRSLPALSKRIPVVVSVRDTWLLSGHCAYTFDCERWRSGCGRCPDLTIYPAVRRDATRGNWERKRRIFENSALAVAAPSRWIRDRVESSILRPAVRDMRIIPNGVDIETFRPAPRPAGLRERLGLSEKDFVLLFAANGIRQNRFKDYPALRDSVAALADRVRNRRVILLAAGEEAPTERIGGAEIRFVPREESESGMAELYRCADVYLHAARAENFPNSILEAMASGLPVIATAVGGIPDQVRSLRRSGARGMSEEEFGPERATGILVPPGDSKAMSEAAELLFRDEALRRTLGNNGRARAEAEFGVKTEVSSYLGWYEELIGRFRRERLHADAA